MPDTVGSVAAPTGTVQGRVDTLQAVNPSTYLLSLFADAQQGDITTPIADQPAETSEPRSRADAVRRPLDEPSIVDKTQHSVEAADDERRKYRFWPLEPLLAEANSLADKCLDTLRRLDALWKEEAGLQLQETLDISDGLASSAEEQYDCKVLEAAQKEAAFFSTTTVVQANVGITPETLASGTLKNETAIGAERYPLEFYAPLTKSDGQVANNAAAASPRLLGYAAMPRLIQLSLQDLHLSNTLELTKHLNAAKAERREGAASVRMLRAELRTRGEPLDFPNQIQRELKLLKSTHLRDLLERCGAIRLGLTNIFGWQCDPIPDPLEPDVIPNYVSWVRTQASRLARFTQLDQGYTVSISLGGLGVRVRTGESLRFSIPKAAFASHRYTRLRGLTAFIGTTKADTVARVTLRAPTSALYINDDGELPAVHQGDVPPCTLGRVAVRGAVRQPEVGGAVSLMNASPIASAGNAWTVRLEVDDLSSAVPIDDLWLELSLVGRPVISGE